jgi:drug/metabolite transporter (DMT)-like permease
VNEAVLLSLFAALVFGVYLVGIKQYCSHYPPSLLIVVVNVFALAWYAPIAVLTVSGGRFLPATLSLQGVAILLGTVAFTALALLAFFHGLAIGDVSYVAPLSKIVPVFVLPIEVLALGQGLTTLQVVGVLVATAAVYVANYRSEGLLTPLRRAATNRAAQFALLSAATFGVVDVGKRLSMQELAIPPQTFVPVLFVGVALLLAPLAIRERDAVDVRPDLSKLVALGLLVAVAQHVVAVAFQTQPASIVSPLVNTQAVVAVVLGSLLLNEPQVRTRLAAAGLAVGGIALITLG